MVAWTGRGDKEVAGFRRQASGTVAQAGEQGRWATGSRVQVHTGLVGLSWSDGAEYRFPDRSPDRIRDSGMVGLGAQGRGTWVRILESGTLKLRARSMDDALSFKSETPRVHGVLESGLIAVKSGGRRW